MNSPPIKVASASEQHAHVAQHRCECGGELDWVRAELRHVGPGEWFESVWTSCRACDKELLFEFDITEAIEGGGNAREMAAFQRAWPPPQHPPYIVRARDYQLAGQVIAAEMESGTIPTEEAERRLLEKLQSCHPLIGGRYRVFGHRRGSMGICYLCIDEQGGTPAVAKTIPLSERGNPDVLHALRREAEVWVRLGSHPHIVALTDILAHTPDCLTLVMELVPPGPAGRTTLREWIHAGALADGLALRFARNIASAMVHATEKVPGLVHGDLKPENILVSSSLSAMVSDFGLARADTLPGPRLSASGLGTKLYLAPECWSGGQATERSDLYAFGLIVCEMLTGRHPFSRARTDEDLAFDHVNSEPTVPEGLLGTVASYCMRKKVQQRPSSFRDVLASLGGTVDPSGEECSASEWNNRGTALAALGRHDEAIRCYDEALAMEPTNPTGWVNLGVSWAKLGRHERAMQAYRQALVLDPKFPHAHANMGALYMRAGRAQDALAACDAALRAHPDLLIALVNRAAALNSLGRYEEAAATGERAMAQDARHPHVLIEMGTAYWRLRRFAKARSCAKRALEIDPQFEPAQRLLNLIRQGRGEGGGQAE